MDSIVITHWHLDHWGDLVPWVWGATVGPGQGAAPPELWVPPGGRGMLEAVAAGIGQAHMFDRVFEVHEYTDGEPFSSAGFEVVPHRVIHYDLVAFGFRVGADGVTLGYSGDSGPSDALAELARDVDLFLCEATLGDDGYEGGLRGHLTVAEALASFRESGARRLLLTHRPVERPLGDGLVQAYDGLELEL